MLALLKKSKCQYLQQIWQRAGASVDDDSAEFLQSAAFVYQGLKIVVLTLSDIRKKCENFALKISAKRWIKKGATTLATTTFRITTLRESVKIVLLSVPVQPISGIMLSAIVLSAIILYDVNLGFIIISVIMLSYVECRYSERC
jgi:hypothetical protein